MNCYLHTETGSRLHAANWLHAAKLTKLKADQMLRSWLKAMASCVADHTQRSWLNWKPTICRKAGHKSGKLRSWPHAAKPTSLKQIVSCRGYNHAKAQGWNRGLEAPEKCSPKLRETFICGNKWMIPEVSEIFFLVLLVRGFILGPWCVSLKHFSTV